MDDTSRLPMSPSARPKRVIITLSRVATHRLSMDVAITYADGSKVHSHNVATLDGSAVRVTGTPEADQAAMIEPRANVLVLALGKNHMPASTRVYSVQSDGRHMVETAVGYDGQPTIHTHYFTRLVSGPAHQVVPDRSSH
ncbi:hypothetical protein [Oleiagrimonas sp. C23AA]|uniref:hypothetical protein n=1 Tax=Oleiagrimonas sp. C23AA TaxID=2719047 RepID=UPI00141E2B5E|nr:hypothetical protein [Oleiagrimonas sp. C23AA]NII09515.1 hypothetical protein [Oleiagrimonas sp. C23AA]